MALLFLGGNATKKWEFRISLAHDEEEQNKIPSIIGGNDDLPVEI